MTKPLTPEMVAKVLRMPGNPRWRVTALNRDRKTGYYSGLVIKGPSDHLEFVLIFDERIGWPRNGRMPNTFHVRRRSLDPNTGDTRRAKRLYDYTHYLEMVRKVACRVFKMVGDANPDWVEYGDMSPATCSVTFNSQGFAHVFPDSEGKVYAVTGDGMFTDQMALSDFEDEVTPETDERQIDLEDLI